MSASGICINGDLAYGKHTWVSLILLLYANPLTLASINCFMQHVDVPYITSCTVMLAYSVQNISFQHS